MNFLEARKQNGGKIHPRLLGEISTENNIFIILHIHSRSELISNLQIKMHHLKEVFDSLNIKFQNFEYLSGILC